MPIHPSDTIVPSEPGGALRLDARVASNVFAQSDGIRVIPQYGCEAQMSALNFPTGYVTTFGGAGRPPQPILYSQVDLDFSEFADQRQQCNPSDGTITLWQDGIYEIGFQAAYTLSIANAHVELAIWTDCGAVSIPLPTPTTVGGLNLAEGQPYGTRWQRIGVRNVGYLNTSTQPSTFAAYPYHGHNVRTVVCLRNTLTGAAGQPTFPSSLPAPCRFLTSVQCDTGQNSLARIIGDAPGLTKFWARWLGEPN